MTLGSCAPSPNQRRAIGAGPAYMLKLGNIIRQRFVTQGAYSRSRQRLSQFLSLLPRESQEALWTDRNKYGSSALFTTGLTYFLPLPHDDANPLP